MATGIQKERLGVMNNQDKKTTLCQRVCYQGVVAVPAVTLVLGGRSWNISTRLRSATY